MTSKEFNQFIDSYITDLRSKKKPEVSKKKKRSDIEEDVPRGVSADSIYVIRKPKTAWQKVVQAFTATDEEDFEEKKKNQKKVSAEKEREFEQEYSEIKQVEKKEGIFKRMFSFLSDDVNEAYEDIDTEERINEVPKTQYKEIRMEDVPVEQPKVEAYSEEKPSFFGKVLNFFGLSAEDEPVITTTPVKMQSDTHFDRSIEMKEDMKQVAVITTALIKKLPKDQFRLFKNSSDFEKFKTIMKKHNIIKVKDE